MRSRVTAVILLAFLLCSLVAAQTAPEKWNWRLDSGAMLGDLEGNLAVRGADIPFDINAADVLDMATFFDIGATATRGRDGFYYHFTYMKLSDSGVIGAPVTPTQWTQGPADVTVSFKQVMNEVGYVRDLWYGPISRDKPQAIADVKGYVAARLTSMSLDVSIDQGAMHAQTERSDDWLDPIAGIQGIVPVARKWAFALKAEYGGFGIDGSDNWRVMPSFAYSINQRAAATIGWGWSSLEKDELGRNDATIDYTSKGLTFSFSYGL